MRRQFEDTFFQQDGVEPQATKGILDALIEHLAIVLSRLPARFGD
jgi:hypothetical protein